MTTPLRASLLHLRLNFQLMLAPIFLWGVLAAGGGITLRLAAAFLIVHVALYGGATAFNSCYDRDEGPVGGLLRPPPVPRSLLAASVGLQLAGAAASLAFGAPFVAVYLTAFGLGVAYSHPAVRLKSRPWASLLLVALGQGILGFLLGFFAGGGRPAALLQARVVEAALVAAAATTTLYPLTQVYQAEEDRRRGDRTFAAVYGPGACFRLAAAGAVVSALLLGHYFARHLSAAEGGLLAAGALAAAAVLPRWARSFNPAAVEANYRRVMTVGYVTAAVLGLLILRHLLR